MLKNLEKGGMIMSISLQKGQKVNLSKEKKGLSRVVVGLGWDEVKRSRGFFALKPAPIDCDASAILLQNGRMAGRDDLVYYNNLTHKSGTVRHMGDNLTGEGEGDDEQIVIVVTIYQAQQRKQHFGLIENAFIRLVDGKNDQEILKYNLTEDYSGMTAMIFGEIYRYNGEWKFGAIGQGTRDGGIGEMAARFQK